MLTQNLVSLLDSLGVADNVERRQAEVTLEEVVGRQGFFPSLVELLAIRTDGAAPFLSPSQQVVAVALLKNMQHRIAPQDAQAVLQGMCCLLEAATGASRAVASLLASAVAKRMSRSIDADASLTAPLQQFLHRLLTAGDQGSAASAIACCLELAVEMAPEQLGDFLSALMEPLCSIGLAAPSAQEDNAALVQLRASALHVVAETVERLGAKHDMTAAVVQYHLASLVALAGTSLSLDSEPFNQHIHESLRIILCIMEGTVTFAVDTSEFFLGILQALELDTTTFRTVDESLVLGVYRVTALRWETLARVLKVKKAASTVVKLFRGMLEPVCRLILEACVLPDRVLEMWGSDVNAFLRMESERKDEISWTPRDVAVDCLSLMLPRFGRSWVHLVLQVASEILLEQPSSAEMHAWKLREAALFMMGQLIATTPLAKLEDLGAGNIAATLVDTILNVDLAASTPHFLSARALVLLDDLIKHDASNASRRRALCDRLLLPCVLTTHGALTMVTAIAVTMLRRIVKLCSLSMLTHDAVAERALTALFTSIQSSSATADQLLDDVLYLFLETIVGILRRCRHSAVPLGDATLAAAIPCLLDMWNAHLRDPNVGELVTDAFAILIQNPACDGGCASKLPWMTTILSGQGCVEMLCVIPYVMRMVKEVMQNGSATLANATARALLEPLCQLLLTNDDSSVANASAECLGALLVRASDALGTMSVAVTPSLVYPQPCEATRDHDADWMRQQSSTPPLRSLTGDPRLSPMPLLDEPMELVPLSDVLIAIAATLLREDRQETSLLNVGAYLGPVATGAALFSQEQMGRFLKALVRRFMGPLQSKTAAAELLVPLGVLLQKFPGALLQTLESLGCFSALVEKWLPMLPVLANEVIGVKMLRTTCEAWVAYLEQLPDGHLDSAVVMWREDGARGAPLPLRSAVFVAVAKVLSVVFQRSVEFHDCDASECDDDSSDDDGGDEETSDEDDGDEGSGLGIGEGGTPIASPNGNAPTAARQAGQTTVTKRLTLLPPSFLFFQRMPRLVEQYSDSTRTFFTAGEVNNLVSFMSECRKQ